MPNKLIDKGIDEKQVSRYHSPVMSDRIPEIVDPFYLSDKQRDYKGEIPLAKLVRLANSAKNLDDSVIFQLNFSKIGKLSVIDGYVRAKVQLECQNCLKFMTIEVNSDVKLAIVQSDEEAALIPEDYEALLCIEDKITFSDIIEDEIILSLPAIPKHDNDCFVLQEPEAVVENKGEPRKDSPFSVLANIKKTGA